MQTSVGTKLQAGDRVLVGSCVLTVDEAFAHSLGPDDVVLGIAHTGQLRRIPAAVARIVDDAVSRTVLAFAEMATVDDSQITEFFGLAARRLADDDVFEPIRTANALDVEKAHSRGRSTTRLVLSEGMRKDMIDALLMWQTLDISTSEHIESVQHDGWRVEQWRSPLGVLGFVFEGRPNVFADATGVLRSGNTVVFRIGSDALRTAHALMAQVIEPALAQSGLPAGAVTLVDSPEHAAGWALFSDSRLSLAVARGSGEAVAELGAIAQQTGIPVSLHGTGGAWLIAGAHANETALMHAVEYSLDRKVCNTANVVCVLRDQADAQIPIVYAAAEAAAARRSTHSRIHCVGGAEQWLDADKYVEVIRANGVMRELQISTANVSDLGHEWEWEETPEFFLVVVNHLDEAIELCNTHSPQFVVSLISDNDEEHASVWAKVNAPFIGNGFTRWVDGQFALRRPELGLSNWQHGRLFGRGGVLSGDSAFTVRLRVVQDRSDIRR
jgi:glutamate-5-semialdehyde dehydrogenase